MAVVDTFIQKEMNNYVKFRNGTKMWKDKTKAGLLGDSCNNLYFMPEKWGGKDLLQKVDIAVIRELKEMVWGESLLQFVTPEYVAQAEAVYHNLSIQELSIDNIWFVFEQMLHSLSTWWCYVVYIPECMDLDFWQQICRD